MNLNTFILIIGLFAVTSAKNAGPTESRAIQNFGCNCLMNDYLGEELNLGLEYLNASIYMFHDSVAMKGFGKMFDKFWHNQLENVNEIRKYTILRGGVTQVPSYRLKYDLDDHFANITTVVHKFLEAEKKLNSKLLELHRCASDNKNEMTCRKSVTKGKNFKRALFTPVEDPLTAMYLDQNFLGAKVDRIKYLADLFRDLIRLHRFHRLEDGSLIDLGLNPIGVHMIDYDLEKKY